MLTIYYTVRIPYTAHNATEWHPTEATGKWNVLTRGAFSTHADAVAWARTHLGATEYSIVRVDRMFDWYLDSFPRCMRRHDKARSRAWRAENRARALGWLFSAGARDM